MSDRRAIICRLAASSFDNGRARLLTAVIITRWTIRYSLRQRDKIGDMFRRTVGLNVEACDVFLDQVLHKRDAKMLCAFGSQSALGGTRIVPADASRAGAKRTDSHRN